MSDLIERAMKDLQCAINTTLANREMFNQEETKSEVIARLEKEIEASRQRS